MTIVAGQNAKAADVLAAIADAVTKGGSVTWPISGEVVVSNGSNAPLGAPLAFFATPTAIPQSGGGGTLHPSWLPATGVTAGLYNNANISVDAAGRVISAANGAGGAGGAPGGSNTQVQINNSGTFGGINNVTLTSLVQPFSASLSGAAPASGGGTAAFLRADGSWVAPPGGGTGGAPGGSVGQLQVNAGGGAFGGISNISLTSIVQPFNVLNFGADPTGVAASDSAVAAAIAALPFNGGTVYFPEGTYKLSAIDTTTKQNVNLVGAGEFATMFTPTSGAGTWATLRSAHGSFRNIGVLLNGVTRTGDMFYINAGSVTMDTFAMFVASGSYSVGVHIDASNGNYYTLNNFGLSNLGSNGIGIQIGEINSTFQNVGGIISNGNIANGQNGILIYSCGGTTIFSVDIIQCSSHGFVTFPASGSNVFAIYCIGLFCDTCGDDGINLSTNGGNVGDVIFSGCWSSTNSGSGINLTGISASSLDGITIANSEFINNKKFGIVLSQCQNVLVNSNKAMGNSQGSPGIFAGIAVAAGVGKFIISSNISTFGGTIAQQRLPNSQPYGVVVVAGASDYYSITGNLGWNNMSGNVLDAGSGINKSVIGNVP